MVFSARLKVVRILNNNHTATLPVMRMTKVYHPGGIFNDEKESPIVLYVQLLCLSAPSLCVTCCTVLTRIVVIVPAFVSIPAYVLITIVAALSAPIP